MELDPNEDTNMVKELAIAAVVVVVFVSSIVAIVWSGP